MHTHVLVFLSLWGPSSTHPSEHPKPNSSLLTLNNLMTLKQSFEVGGLATNTRTHMLKLKQSHQAAESIDMSTGSHRNSFLGTIHHLNYFWKAVIAHPSFKQVSRALIFNDVCFRQYWPVWHLTTLFSNLLSHIVGGVLEGTNMQRFWRKHY